MRQVIQIVAVDRTGEKRQVRCTVGSSLMQELRDGAGMDILAECGGNAVCGTCHVFVIKEPDNGLSEPSEQEDELLAGFHFATAASRLSCQIPISEELEGLIVRLAPEE